MVTTSFLELTPQILWNLGIEASNLFLSIRDNML